MPINFAVFLNISVDFERNFVPPRNLKMSKPSYSGIYTRFSFGSALSDISNTVSPTTAEGNALKKNQFISGELIFEDTFESFDSNVWLHEPTNAAHLQEFQLFTDSEDNAYVKDGVLHIKPTIVADNVLENQDFLRSYHPIRSARLSTKDSFSFTYGVLEFKARIPSGDWLFPALWLMPQNSTYGGWPVSGEIDVMESRGNRNLTDPYTGKLMGVQSVGSTLHWGPNEYMDGWKLAHYEKENDSCYSADFHIYKLIWTPDSIQFYVDEEENGIIVPPAGGFWEMGGFDKYHLTNPWPKSSKSAPFDQQFYLIMNLAVGGTQFFPDSYVNAGGKPWSNISPDAGLEFWEGRDQWLPTWNLPSDDSHFLIDYVRVWAL